MCLGGSVSELGEVLDCMHARLQKVALLGILNISSVPPSPTLSWRGKTGGLDRGMLWHGLDGERLPDFEASSAGSITP